MGITIHYRFIKKENPKELIKIAKELAKKLNWEIREKKGEIWFLPSANCEGVDITFKKWKDVKKIEDWDYTKETLEEMENKIDEDYYVCSAFCKTQYAGIKSHIEVAEFLRVIASNCYIAEVSDEGDYYESKDINRLKEDFDSSAKMINGLASMLKKNFGKEKVYTSQDNLN